MFETEKEQIRHTVWAIYPHGDLEEEVQACRGSEQPGGWPAHVVLLADHPDLGDVPERVVQAIQMKLDMFYKAREAGASYNFMYGNQPQYVIDRVQAYNEAQS